MTAYFAGVFVLVAGTLSVLGAPMWVSVPVGLWIAGVMVSNA